MMSAIPIKKSGRRFRFRLLVLSCIISVVLHRGHVLFSKNNSLHGGNATIHTEAWVNSIGSDDENAVLESIEEEPTAPSSSAVVLPPMIKPMDTSLEPSNIPIYVSEASSGAVSVIDYRFFASIWDRDTTYDDILLYASSTNGTHSSSSSSSSSSSADKELQRKLKRNNATVIFHTSPKTASSTMRKACMQTQYDTCNMPQKPSTMKWPEGYRTPKRLTQLFGQCPQTRHFCVRGGIPVVKNYTRFYDSRTPFVHMFPFRNYDEWTVSALHQIFYREGEKGCREAEKLLDECLPHQFELDFGKYTKSMLSNFVVHYKQLRSSSKKVNNDHHIVVLYDYRNLHETLTWLNDAYGVPLLPGTDAKMNSARPDESCEEEENMLGKFHDCFSGDLAGLHNSTVQHVGRRKRGN